MPPAIQLTKLCKSFGANHAVMDVSLEVARGEVLGLLGPNGAGKSTTLYMMAGLIRPDSGRITLFGDHLQQNRLSILKRMGVLLERPVFYEHLTVERNLKIHAQLSGVEVNLHRTLDLAGILPLADHRTSTLSLGMRQRLGLARAMVNEPELLLLDEPTNGLDVEGNHELLRFLRRLADEAKVTILFSSHQMQEVETLCDRVAIMNEGKLITCEQTESLLSYDQTQVEVLLEGADRAAKKLADLDWVAEIDVRPGRLRLRLKTANVHQLTSFLINNGFTIAGIIPRRRTLQDYFLKVMNKQPEGDAS